MRDISKRGDTMSACVFFGHRQCHQLERDRLYAAIEDLIHQGVEAFYVGNQGQFDAMVYGCLKQLKRQYPGIRYYVVLAYLPGEKELSFVSEETLYPEEVAKGTRKFAIHRRNCWLVKNANYCICYITHTWGGAYRYVEMAEKRGVSLINIGSCKEKT